MQVPSTPGTHHHTTRRQHSTAQHKEQSHTHLCQQQAQELLSSQMHNASPTDQPWSQQRALSGVLQLLRQAPTQSSQAQNTAIKLALWVVLVWRKLLLRLLLRS